MTRGSIREYTEAVRLRYLWASKKEKGKILDEFTQVTRLHRKAAIRLLRRAKKPPSDRKRGRPRKYGAEAAMQAGKSLLLPPAYRSDKPYNSNR